MPDAEIEAIGKIAEALEDLQEDERGRVLRWAAERYDVVIGKARGGKVDEVEDDDIDDDNDGNGSTSKFETFAELYDAADPTGDAERVLLASYWAQVIQGKQTYGSQELNKILKDLGHGVNTINHAMSTNIEKKPALILQMSRGGSTRQARKKYKLTEAGKKWVVQKLG